VSDHEFVFTTGKIYKKSQSFTAAFH